MVPFFLHNTPFLLVLLPPFSTPTLLLYIYMHPYPFSFASPVPFHFIPLLSLLSSHRTAGRIPRPVPPILAPSHWSNVWSSSQSQRPSPRRKHGEDTFPNWIGNETEASSPALFLDSFPGASAPEWDIEVTHAERAWYMYFFSRDNLQR